MKAIYRAAAVAITVVSFTCSAWAQSERKTGPKKVDVKNLEKRYWAPKDKKFKVVQSRTYTKTKKIALSIMPSLMLNEEYSKGFGVDVAVSYYFNDRWGIELEYQGANLEDNDVQNEIVALNGFANNGEFQSYLGVSARWLPFYAKMSFLGTKIVYFDLSLGLTAGLVSYEQLITDPSNLNNADRNSIAGQDFDQTAVAFGFDVSQSFYLSKKLLLRADYKHRFYSQDLIAGATKGLVRVGDSLGSRSEDSISLNLGLTYLF